MIQISYLAGASIMLSGKFFFNLRKIDLPSMHERDMKQHVPEWAWFITFNFVHTWIPHIAFYIWFLNVHWFNIFWVWFTSWFNVFLRWHKAYSIHLQKKTFDALTTEFLIQLTLASHRMMTFQLKRKVLNRQVPPSGAHPRNYLLRLIEHSPRPELSVQ